jgi:hypothetical protein
LTTVAVLIRAIPASIGHVYPLESFGFIFGAGPPGVEDGDGTPLTPGCVGGVGADDGRAKLARLPLRRLEGSAKGLGLAWA